MSDPLRFRHKKRGTTYTGLFVADLQSSTLCAEGTQLMVYRADADGHVWARPLMEFDDGRFERIDTPFVTDDHKTLVERLERRAEDMSASRNCPADETIYGRAATAIEALAARAEKAERERDEARKPVAWLYFNEDSGDEIAASHPVESGEVPDATNIRPIRDEAAVEAIRDAWDCRLDMTRQLAESHAALAAAQADAEKLREAQSQAARDVLAERRRQIEGEGWTLAHDDAHANGELAMAAGVYAIASRVEEPSMASRALEFWPWDSSWLKTPDRRRCLVKSGALILAEIDRLDREAARVALAQGGRDDG